MKPIFEGIKDKGISENEMENKIMLYFARLCISKNIIEDLTEGCTIFKSINQNYLAFKIKY